MAFLLNCHHSVKQLSAAVVGYGFLWLMPALRVMEGGKGGAADLRLHHFSTKLLQSDTIEVARGNFLFSTQPLCGVNKKNVTIIYFPIDVLRILTFAHHHKPRFFAKIFDLKFHKSNKRKRLVLLCKHIRKI